MKVAWDTWTWIQNNPNLLLQHCVGIMLLFGVQGPSTCWCSVSLRHGSYSSQKLRHVVVVVVVVSLVFFLNIGTTNATATDAISSQNTTATDESSSSSRTCSWLDNDDCHLRSMTVDLGPDRPKDHFLAYVTPDVATFYNNNNNNTKPIKAKRPKFQGQFGKFINLSPSVVRIMWDPITPPNQPHLYISDIDAFEAAGTATYPGHVFHVVQRDRPSKVLTTFYVVADQSLYVYDPFDHNVTQAQSMLSSEQFQLYQLQHDNLLFAEQYRQFTGGREWLALYSRKHPPRHFMWPANFLGQEHVVSTQELPFVQVPPDHLLGLAKDKQKKKSFFSWAEQLDEQDLEQSRQLLQPYRGIPDRNTTTSTTTWNLTLKVLSCSPRVFEISNFLSPSEVDHILQLATGMTLAQSTTRAGRSGEERHDSSTRTSQNSWITREESWIIDALYRRAADVLQMDEQLFRYRSSSPDDTGSKTDALHPHPKAPESQFSIAERLQLVHYDVGQQYTAHHDFSVPGLSDGQPSRFATMLFYLNDAGLKGGETSFPRWLNAKTSKALKVKPKTGKAILFYNVLPDGNYDERSQHAAEIVKKGEKWLTNLWVWDPYLEYGR